MKILNGVLNEELDRLNKLKKNYEKQIAKLPKEALSKKISKGIYTITLIIGKKKRKYLNTSENYLEKNSKTCLLK